MHKHVTIGFILAAGLVAAGTAAQAQSAVEQRVDHRQDRQEQRIEQGISSGSLTQPEARRLGREQARLTRAEARVEADGRVTRREAAAIEHRQDHASRHIAHAKHDRQVRRP